MARQSIDSLKPQVSVDEVYRVVEKQMRANRQGGSYLLIQLADRMGSFRPCAGMATQHMYDSFLKEIMFESRRWLNCITAICS